MADRAHGETDRILEAMERRLSAIYREADKGIQEKAEKFFSKFSELDEKKKELVKAGKLSADEYETWRKNKILYSKRFEQTKEDIAKQLLNVNRTAVDYINGRLPEIYTLNYNAFEDTVIGELGGYSFVLTDAETVRNLAMKDESFLPYKYVDGVKDVRWNVHNVNSQVLQGILTGDSIPKIAARLRHVTEMNKVSSIRNARTSVTSAECKGRQDSYVRADEDGIKLQREWIATDDGRTRHWHAELDGVLVELKKPFENEFGKIMYPGDPTANPSNVYNCRCTIAAKVIGFAKNAEAEEKQNAEKSLENENRNPSKEELRSAEWYVSGEGQWVNKYLRGDMNVTITKSEAEAIDSLDSLTKRDIVAQKTLYRSVDAQAIFGKMSQIEYEKLRDTVIYGENSKKKLIAETIGKEIKEGGFMSTTKSKEIAAGWGDFTGSTKPVVMELSVPKGTHGFDMKQFEVSGEEQEEVLLAKGQKYKIRSISSEKIKIEDDIGEYYETVIYINADIL